MLAGRQDISPLARSADFRGAFLHKLGGKGWLGVGLDASISLVYMKWDGRRRRHMCCSPFAVVLRGKEFITFEKHMCCLSFYFYYLYYMKLVLLVVKETEGGLCFAMLLANPSSSRLKQHRGQFRKVLLCGSPPPPVPHFPLSSSSSSSSSALAAGRDQMRRRRWRHCGIYSILQRLLFCAALCSTTVPQCRRRVLLSPFHRAGKEKGHRRRRRRRTGK